MKRKTVGYSSDPAGDTGFTWATGGDVQVDGLAMTHVAGLEEIPDDVIFTEDADWDDLDISAEHTDGFDITAFTNDDGLYGPFPDLEWMDPSQTQDPARLPHGNDDIRDELLGQWDANKSKFLLRQAKDIDDLRNPDIKRKTAVNNPRQLQALTQYGLQLAHQGDSADAIRHKLASQIQGSGLDRLMEKVIPHVGLAGRFYILADAFPKMEAGRWKKVLGRLSSARFLVVSSRHPLRSRHHFLGREVVSSIPLDRIWEDYLPTLRLADSEADKLVGQEDVSNKTKVKILRRAHQMESRLSEAQENKRPVRETYTPRYDPNAPLLASEKEASFSPELLKASQVQDYLDDLTASGFLSAEEAEGFQGLSLDRTVLATRNYILKHKRAQVPSYKKSALYKGPRWKQTYRATLVANEQDSLDLEKIHQATTDEARERIASLLGSYGYSEKASAPFLKGDPRKQFRALMLDIQKGHKIPVPRSAKTASYSGHELKASRSLEVGPDYDAMQLQAQLIASRGEQGAAEAMNNWLKRGWLTEEEHGDLMTLPPKRALYAAQLLIFNTRRNVPVPRSAPSKGFGGAVLTAQQSVRVQESLTSEDALMQRRAQSSGVPVRDIKSAVRWVKEQMNRGWAGRLLTAAYERQFSSNLKEAAAPYVKELRDQYEGLAGHLLIDASAYSNGSAAGCDVGAAHNRANGVKLLLAMDACASCVFQNSEGGCSKYGKTLIEAKDLDNAEVRRIQAKNKRLANKTDAEKMSELFANEYDGDVYDIVTPALDLEAYPEAEDYDDSDILMGGFILP